MGKDRDKATVDRVFSEIREKFQIEPFQFDPIRHPILARAVASSGNPTNSSSSNGGVTRTNDTTTNSGSAISLSLGKYLNILDRTSSTAQETLQDVSSLSSKFSFTDQIEKMISEYLTATMVGVALGSAVTAGLGAGLIAASNILSSPKYMKSVCQIIFRKFRKKTTAKPVLGDDDFTDDNQTDSRVENVERIKQGTNISCLGRNDEIGSKIFLLRGTVRSESPSQSDNCGYDQCQECLDHVSVLLVKQGLGWKDVRQITAYLVVDCCNAEDFRDSLKQYPLEVQNTIVNILFVQKLEYGNVQLEVLACSSQ